MTDFKRVFVDTAPIIYYLEHSDMYLKNCGHCNYEN